MPSSPITPAVIDSTDHSLLGVRAPVESTMRKLFARLDAAALDTALAVFAWCRVQRIEGRRVIAIDGKTVRGARSKAATAPHLIAALDHATGVVLGQHTVPTKSNEIPAVRDLLAGFDPADLHGCVVAVDGLRCAGLLMRN